MRSLKKTISESPVNRSSAPLCWLINRPMSVWYSRSTAITSSTLQEVLTITCDDHLGKMGRMAWKCNPTFHVGGVNLRLHF
jgi:hypothetical protein